MGKIVSVNVGSARQMFHEGRMVRTGIFKTPVVGRVRVDALNLEGDEQADLSVHGGAGKAIYVYPAEHYEFWRRELPQVELPWGSFGENVNTEGVLEKEIHVGDRLCAGTVELIVTEPRLPCYKLNLKFGREDMVKRFLRSRRTGFYLAVAREGEIGAGDSIQFVGRDPQTVSIAEITRLYAFERNDIAALRRAASVQALPESWRAYFAKRASRGAE
jgi:MOSC domain-containing protein YiiM